MSYEKRLFLAIGLSMGILLFWSTITPPPPIKTPAPAQSSGPVTLTVQAETGEPAKDFSLGPYEMKVGIVRGGIHSLQVEGKPLLREADPGLLEIRETGRSDSLHLETRLLDGKIVSEATLRENVVLVRTIRRESQRHPNLLEMELELRNDSTEQVEIDLSAAVYKPLVALHHDQKRYLAGIAWMGTKAEALKVQPGQKRVFSMRPDWVVSQGKSDAVVIGIPSVERGMFHVEHPAGRQVSGWMVTGPIQLVPQQQVSFRMPFYVGPMVLSELKKVGMEGTLSFGAFSGITRWLLRFLSWGERRFHNYGWAICFLSLAVWLPFSPLTFYGMRMSQDMQKKMAELKPQEQRIRKEHAKNPQKMQQELMGLYRKHKVNPASGCIGCLPFLLTWPLYIALFEVLTRAPELRGASFFWIRDLAMPDGLIRFPAALPLLGDHLNVLPFFAAAGTFLQQKVMQRPSAELTEEQKMQQQMFKIFPLLFIVIFYNLPAGFMLYWVINTVLMGGQQVLAARLTHR